MKVYNDPKNWEELILRPTDQNPEFRYKIQEIFKQVQNFGDEILKRYTRAFDRAEIDDFALSKSEYLKAQVSSQLAAAIDLARNNIEKFHRAQREDFAKVETVPGVKCWQKSLPIERVGLYIPGGTAPLISTVLMLGVPAKIAGCREVVLCTPPGPDGQINPAIIYTARTLGIEKIFKVGGAQAIAAMTFGTETIPGVDKIFGPGNQFVTAAKELAQQYGVAIDMPAGPSEVLVIADKSSNPAFVAADLLSQAEHGSDSQVVLLTNDEGLVSSVQTELELQLKNLPRKEIAEKALENSYAAVFEDLDTCMKFSNHYAPEHLIIQTAHDQELEEEVAHAGSVFLGPYSCESMGDYASGTNHTLPTNGYARNYSGVSLDSFFKKITFQEISAAGIQAIGPAVEILADAEQLEAHKRAVSIRLKSLVP
jgi:histidinol dehydrogenase